MYALRILCLSLLAYQGHCCTKKKNPVKQNVWQRLVGNDITTSPYSSSGDHPVGSCDELNCNFESGGCCWSNASPPTDQLDWVTVSGPPEPKKLQSSFGTQAAPSGTALGVGSETAASDGSSQQAQLYSCPIPCTAGTVTVSLKHWQSKDVTLKVCQETDPAGPPNNCQSLSSSSGNSDSVSMPTIGFGQNARIVIIASGFTAKAGSVAIIDDISVQCSICVSTTTTAPTTTVVTTQPATTIAPAVCKALTCDFEQGNTCSYTNAQGAGGTKQWGATTTPFQNLLTGIKYPPQGGGKYIDAVYLNPGDSAVMSTNVNFPAGYIVQFQGYRATEGIDLMACCDSVSNCPYSTTKNVQTSDYRSWKQATVTCPAGTQKVLFQAKNTGTNYGAAGIDNIQVISQVGSSPLC